MIIQRAVLILLGSLMVTNGAWASGELDNEIDSLQVQIVHKNAAQNQKPKKSPKYTIQRKKLATKKLAAKPAMRRDSYTRVAMNDTPAVPAVPRTAPTQPPVIPQQAPVPAYDTTQYAPEPVYAPQAPQPEVSGNQERLRPVDDSDGSISTGNPETVNNNGFLYRISLVPAASISTFDGGGNSQLIPSGVTNPYNIAPATTLLADLNLLGTDNFVLETGANFLQTGAQTGYVIEPWLSNFSYNEKVSLSYAGIPISAKWMAQGEHTSSLFAKLGVNPVFLVGHQYTAYSGYNEEFRFGGYSTIDILITAGLGYTFRLGKNYQLVIDVEGFQGTIPVLSTYNVFNVGGTAGIGLSYLL